MLYLIALLFPFVSILLCGKPFQAIFNFILFVLGLVLFTITLGATSILNIICIVHAFFVIHSRNQDKRTERIIQSMKK